MIDKVLFDDWKTREPKALKRVKIAYIICLVLMSICLVVCMCIPNLFEKIISILVWASIILMILMKFLKVKNNHLIIRTNQIRITNRFNKTSVYKIDYKNLIIQLEHSYRPKTHMIIMKFLDNNGNFIALYEDVVNVAC